MNNLMSQIWAMSIQPLDTCYRWTRYASESELLTIAGGEVGAHLSLGQGS